MNGFRPNFPLLRPGGPARSKLLLALVLCLILPGHAAQQSSPRKPGAERQTKTAQATRVVAPMRASQTSPTLSSSSPALEPAPAATDPASPVPPAVTPVAAENPSSGASAASPVPVAGPAPSPSAAAPATNPYLAGWYVPTSVNELPRLAAQQLSASVRWTYATVVGLPGNVVEALPKIRRVFPTGGRELWVANLKCPAEMVTGQYFFPANALRDAVNGLLGTINEMRLFNFDIQLVCS